MPLQRYDMNASDACVSYPDINGNWCNASDVVELEKSYAELEEANAELMNHLKSWLSVVRPVTGKEVYWITSAMPTTRLLLKQTETRSDSKTNS